MTDTIKLNTILTLLKQEPQQKQIELLNSLVFLLPINYITGNKHLSKIEQELPEDLSLENLFNIYNELLVTDANTIILFSTKPFNIKINIDGEILPNIYQFSYTSADTIDLYVSNHSLEDDVDITYIVANTDLLGSSYVYS
jgi:hypothetical protein